MPVRRQVTRDITERFVGVHVWNGLLGECRTMPTATYDEVRDAADSLYDFVVRRIDWNRILLEASARHSTLRDSPLHEVPRYAPTVEGICPSCLREALLAEDRLTDWMVDGVPDTAPSVDHGQDWAATLAAGITHRRPSTTNGAS